MKDLLNKMIGVIALVIFSIVLFFSCNTEKLNDNSNATSLPNEIKLTAKQEEILSKGNSSTNSKESTKCKCDGDGIELHNLKEIPTNYSGKFYKCFEDTCLIEITGSIVKGKRACLNEDMEVYYHRNGKVKAKGDIWDNSTTGIWEFYYENGQLKAKGPWIGNRKSGGVWETYYENGQLDSKGKHDYDGVKVDYWEYYYESGQIAFKGYFKGEHIGYYENGKIEREGTFALGLMTRYYENGQIKEQGNYAYDKRVGIWKFYDEQGSLLKIKEY